MSQIFLQSRNAYTATPPRPSLRSSVVWSLTSSVVYNGCQWGMIIALARLGDVAMVGRYALAMAIATPVVLLAACALRTVQATDAKQEFSFSDYLAVRLLGLTATAAVLLTIAWQLERSTGLVLLAVGGSKIVESLSDLLHGVMQRNDRLDWIGVSQIARGTLSLGAFATAIFLVHDLPIASEAMLIVNLAILIGYDLPVVRRLLRGESFRPTPSMIALLIRMTAPLGVTVALGAVIAYLPRYAIEYFRGAEELGAFAAVATFTLAGNLVATAVCHAVLPKLSRAFAEHRQREFRDLLGKILLTLSCLGLLGVGAGVALGPWTIQVCLGPEFVRHANLLLPLLIAMIFAMQICCLDHAFYAARRFALQAPINALVCVVLAVVCWLLVPHYGALGAAWAACIGFLVQLLCRIPFAIQVSRFRGQNHAASQLEMSPICAGVEASS